MKKHLISLGGALLTSCLLLNVSGVYAEEPKARSLDELLRLVEQGRLSEAKESRQREERFTSAKNRQAAMIKEAQTQREQEEQRSAELEKAFEENDKKLAEIEKRLRERMGSLSELFGHMTSAAGDARSNFENSLTSIHHPERIQFLDELVAKTSSGTELPSIDMIERLWFELQREMVESGKTVSFSSGVVKPNGEQAEQTVVRVGNFNIVSQDGKYLTNSGNKGLLEELARQPSTHYTTQAAALVAAKEGFTRFGIDPTGPTGGSFLSALINSPNLEERWRQGGIVGYIISALGGVAALIALGKFLSLLFVSLKVRSQLKADQARPNNPLGRVLMVHEQNPTMDAETAELKLNEAVLKELPALERSIGLLKIIAAIAPLLGLLGTVTGMIITFQAITIFGAGDPQAMAGGISGALVTTVLGLIVAIPTVLMHTLVNGRSKSIIHILEEQTAGLIAQHNEARG